MSKVLKYAKSIVGLLVAATSPAAYFLLPSDLRGYAISAAPVLVAAGVALAKNSASNDLAVAQAIEHTGFLPAKYDEALIKLIDLLEKHLPSKDVTEGDAAPAVASDPVEPEPVAVPEPPVAPDAPPAPPTILDDALAILNAPTAG